MSSLDIVLYVALNISLLAVLVLWITYWVKMSKIKSKNTVKLDEQMIVNILDDDKIDDNIIEDLYNFYKELIFQEQQRSEQLDSKSNTHLGLISIAITILLTFGGLLIEKIMNFELSYLDIPYPIFLMVLLFSLAFMLFVVSFCYSISATKVQSPITGRSHVWFNDENIFDYSQIKKGKKVYRTFLITHYWSIYNHNKNKVNDVKAERLRKAQISSLCAIISLIPLMILLSSYILANI